MKRLVASTLICMLLLPAIVLADDRVSMGYIYATSQSHTQVVDNTFENINVVSPTSLDLDVNGHLEVNGIFNKEFIEDMHERGIKVTPFLSNHWGRVRAERALSMPDVVTDEVLQVVEEYDLDGVNIDFENLVVADKALLVDFVRMLREKMPEEKTISVAVAANPNDLKSTWIAAYDYKELAKYSDYLVLMAYDEHSEGGAKGPVASYNFVKQSIEEILKDVSRDKVVLGIPLYGRLWRDDAEYGGEAIAMAQVDRIAKRYNVVPVYDKKTNTPSVKIEVLSGERKAYVNGRYLEEGTYEIFYENKNSILSKLNLMNEYGLKGSALWALDNEDKSFWSYYEEGFRDDKYESEETVARNAMYKEFEEKIQTIELLKIKHIAMFITEVPKEEQFNPVDNRNIEITRIKEIRFEEKVIQKIKDVKNIKDLKEKHIISNYKSRR